MGGKCRQANMWARYEKRLSNSHSCLLMEQKGLGSRKLMNIMGLQTRTKRMLQVEACHRWMFGFDDRDVTYRVEGLKMCQMDMGAKPDSLTY